jgi:hypothetical protein
VTASCPLPKGTCMWKHRIHGQCTYDEEFADSDFSANEFAKHVGLPPIDESVEQTIRQSLADAVRAEFS